MPPARTIRRVTKRQHRAILYSSLLGSAACALVVAAQLAGGLERLELITLDLRFRSRWINPIQESEQITCIDIGDRDLETVGRWPWPRDYQAAILSVLAELQPVAVLVDITYVEPEPLRTETPNDGDVAYDSIELTESNPEQLFPDFELRNALERSGKIYLAFHHPAADLERSVEFNAAVDALVRGDRAAANAALAEVLARHAALRRTLPEGETLGDERPLDRARIVALLQENPDWGEAQVLDQLGYSDRADVQFIEAAFPRCLSAALRRRAQRWLAENPLRYEQPPAETFRALFESVSERPFENNSGVKRSLAVAFREVLGEEATARQCLPFPAALRSLATPVEAVTPVYFLHARAARRCGFVNFEPDRDGVMRRERLVIRHGDRLYSQLALTVACDVLGVSAERIEYSPGALRLPTPTGPIDLQLQPDGRFVLPWTPGNDFARQFRRIPANALWMVAEHRRLRDYNLEVIQDELAQLINSPGFEEGPEHIEELDAIASLGQQALHARYRGNVVDAEALEGMIRNLEQRVAEREARYAARIRADFEKAMADPTALPEGELERVAGRMSILSELERFEKANVEITRVVDDAIERLRPLVQGKVCLVGYTATSLADMTPIPTHPRAPGVMAHANLLNGLLTRQLVTWTTPAASTALTVLCGVAATIISVLRRPRDAVLGVGLVALVYVGMAGWLAFRWWLLWAPLAAPLAAIALAYVSIAVFRYIFVEGESRHLATALAQYTSREIARQVAENPELCQRAESRVVTAVFTDLRGFTSISEQIGAERTQKVLNTCLGCFSDVMLRHEAMINKFIGDGIFAFWNPVIYPQPDHALRACETAVDLFDALETLKREQRERSGDEVFGSLALRVGVATGRAVVGPCGSAQKFDYTCIGDSVNVAARLESANKFYGTRVLVNSTAREQVGDRFAFRALGGVRVKGKQQAVQVLELLGRTGQTPPALLDYAREFGAAVEWFQQRRWTDARSAFEACLRSRPEDLAAREYAMACERLAGNPPPDDWTGALELSEK